MYIYIKVMAWKSLCDLRDISSWENFKPKLNHHLINVNTPLSSWSWSSASISSSSSDKCQENGVTTHSFKAINSYETRKRRNLLFQPLSCTFYFTTTLIWWSSLSSSSTLLYRKSFQWLNDLIFSSSSHMN